MDTFEGSVWSVGDEDVLRELRLSRQAIREVLRDLTVELWSCSNDVRTQCFATEVGLWDRGA